MPGPSCQGAAPANCNGVIPPARSATIMPASGWLSLSLPGHGKQALQKKMAVWLGDYVWQEGDGLQG